MSTDVRWNRIVAVTLGLFLAILFCMWAGELGETIFEGDY